jgi:hypothetical protein
MLNVTAETSAVDFPGGVRQLAPFRCDTSSVNDGQAQSGDPQDGNGTERQYVPTRAA